MQGGVERENFKQTQLIISLTNYCQRTTLHGWSYVVGEEGALKKIIWLIVILALYCKGMSWFHDQYTDYISVSF